MKKPHLSTTAVQGAFDPEQHAGAMAVPVYLTSAYHFPTADDAAEIFNLSKPGYIYTRLNNPTQEVVENRIAPLPTCWNADWRKWTAVWLLAPSRRERRRCSRPCCV